jgi:hypothetical protein
MFAQNFDNVMIPPKRVASSVCQIERRSPCSSESVSRGRTRRGQRRWWSLWKWRFRYEVRVLKSGNQPLTGLLPQCQGLNALSRLRNVWRRFSSNHGPVNVRHRDPGSEEFNLNVINSQSALAKNEDVSIGKLLLNLRPPFPPPPHYVDQIAIFREQGGIGFCVVPVPRFLLPCLHEVPDLSFVLTLIGTQCFWR